MKVLLISGAFPPMNAGEADHAFHLCHHLLRRGIDVHVLTTATRLRTDDALGFEVDRGMRNWSVRDLPKLIRVMRQVKPDAVLLIYTDWVYGRHHMITFAPLLARMLLPGAVFVTQLETCDAQAGESLVARIILKVLRYFVPTGASRTFHLVPLMYASHHVITLSERYRNELVESYRALNDKISIIPPPPIMNMCKDPDRGRLRTMTGTPADVFQIAYFGYINPSKGVDTLFEAMRILKLRGRSVRLVLIGGGVDFTNPSADVRHLRDLADRLEITDRILWTGQYDSRSDEASRYLYASDVCVLPFTRGVTLNRSSCAAAAAHGLPIVTTRGVTLAGAFVNGHNVYLCPPKDPEALAQAVEALIGDRNLASRLASGALALAKESFSWDTAVTRTIEALASGNSGVLQGAEKPSSASGTPG
jgi:glycosyltransferase involved in cell wall biosynthesis